MESSTRNESDSQGPLFKDLKADDPEPEATEIESLCLECEEMVGNCFALVSQTIYNIK